MNDRHPLTLHSLLSQLGPADAPDGAGPALWLVEQGCVDVFLVAMRAGLPHGARSHLYAAGAGQLLLLPALAAGLPYTLLAVPAAGARHRVLAQSAVAALLADAAWHEAAAVLFDDLAARLAGALPAALPPGAVLLAPGAHYPATAAAAAAATATAAEAPASTATPQPAAPGAATAAMAPAAAPPVQPAAAAPATPQLAMAQVPTVQPADMLPALAAEPAGLWLELQAGAAHYLDQPAAAAARWLPLPPRAWLRPADGATLRTCSGHAACAAAGGAALLAGLAALGQAVYEVAAQQRCQDEADELARLQRQQAINGQAMRDALGGLAALFGAGQAMPGGAGAPGADDRLLAACRLVGAHCGIQFQPAPAIAPGARRRTPLRDIAQASGVRSRRVALKGDWWREDNGALLVFAQDSGLAYAVLPARGGYRVTDPASGQSAPVTAAFAASLAHFGYVFYAGLPARPLVLADLLRFVLPGIRSDLGTVAAIALASALLGMAIPIASGHLFDSVFPAADHGQMVQVVLILFLAGLVTLLFDATRALTMLRIEGKAGHDLQAAVWDRVLNLPAPFFRDYAAGDLATRINAINEIRQVLSGTIISTIISSLFSILNVLLLFYYSVKLALVALALLALAVGCNVALGWCSLRISRRTAELGGKVTGLVLEYLSAIAKLRVTGAEARAFANWAARFAAQKRAALRAGRLATASAVFGAAFPLAAHAVLFACIGAALADAGAVRLSTGDFIAFCAAWTMLLGAALALVRCGVDVLAIATTYERTRPILAARPEVDEHKAQPGTLSGAIELSNVRFAYGPDAPPVLHDVSLRIAAGEFVALVGASGSGKSTLLRLLLGFERPDSGAIYYDGHNLDDVDLGAVRRQLGVVLQSGRLMSGDIYSNIVGSTALSREDAWEAARACGLDQDIQAMPMGLHTYVSDGGSTLSGGQRQRLLIARAIVSKPRIVLFDEATSALDNQSQAVVSASMERLRATRVVIAHRLSTIVNADRIYVMDQGRIVQSGSYQQLMAQPGLFADLAQRQLA
ncbi:MAG: NHLP bacteriocin export ABC transporter permease/ATPase subunit [Pseudomonadota bacterium]